MTTQKDFIINIRAKSEQAEDALERVNRKTLTFTDSLTRLSAKFIVLQYSIKLASEYLFKISNIENFKTIENGILGIASSYSTLYNMIDKTGKVMSSDIGFLHAIRLAKDDLEDLRVANLQTAATLDELIKAYQTALPIATRVGFTPEQTKAFTVRAVQAASAFDPELLRMMPEELRSLLTGNINERTSRLALVLGITPDDIRKHKANANDLFKFLMEKMGSLGIAGQYSMKTVSGVISNLKDAISLTQYTIFEDFVNALKNDLLDILNSLININKETGKIELTPEFKSDILFLKNTINGIAATIRLAVGFSKDAFITPISAVINALTGLYNFFGIPVDILSGGKTNFYQQTIKGFQSSGQNIKDIFTVQGSQKALDEIAIKGIRSVFKDAEVIPIRDWEYSKIREIINQKEKEKVKINGREISKYITNIIGDFLVVTINEQLLNLKTQLKEAKHIDDETQRKTREKLNDFWRVLNEYKNRHIFEDQDIIIRNLKELEATTSSVFAPYDEILRTDSSAKQAYEQAVKDARISLINKYYKQTIADLEAVIQKEAETTIENTISNKILSFSNSETYKTWEALHNIGRVSNEEYANRLTDATLKIRENIIKQFNDNILESFESYSKTINNRVRRDMTLKQRIAERTDEFLKSKEYLEYKKNIKYVGQDAVMLAQDIIGNIKAVEIERAIDAFDNIREETDKILQELSSKDYTTLEKMLDEYYIKKVEVIEKLNKNNISENEIAVKQFFNAIELKIQEYQKEGDFLSYADGFKAAITKLKDEFYSFKRFGEDLFLDMASSMQKTFSSVFFDAMTGKLTSLKSYLKSFFLSINQAMANFLSNIAMNKIMNNITTGLGFNNNSTGFLVNSLGSIAMAFGAPSSNVNTTRYSLYSLDTGQSLLGYSPYLSIPTKHTGGLVVKMHTGGLLPDEVPTVLQTGEFVVSRKGVKALEKLNSGDTSVLQQQSPVVVNANLNISAVDSKSIVDMVKRNKNVFTNLILQELAGNFQFNKALKNTI